MRRAVQLLAVCASLLYQSERVHAGMPSVRLNDVIRLRFETLSFFLVCFLLSALLVKLLWNRLATDFKFLPRLGCLSALGIVVLWGLLFILVLTMISGARELMTPGAWEKQGFTYRLAEPASSGPEESLDRVRQDKLAALRSALWAFAEAHDGQFPSDIAGSSVPAETWQTPDPSGMHYGYVGGNVAGRGATPLAYEPELYGPRRLVLLTNGDIRFMDGEQIHRARSAGASR